MLERRTLLRSAAAPMLLGLMPFGAVRSFSANPAVAGNVPAGTGVHTHHEQPPREVKAFDDWLGRPAAVHFVAMNQTSWPNFASSIGYITRLWAQREVVWSVPLCSEFGTMPDVAGGVHDAKFLLCARAIENVHPRAPPIMIRLGWEFNLLEQEQRAFDANGAPDAASYAAAFRRVVDIFRSVSPRFRFDWCPNCGGDESTSLDVEACYPGDAYVDVIGMDIYFNNYDPAEYGGLSAWNYKRTTKTGLDWHLAFARSHGKPVAYSEWGVISNEAPAYMERMCEWIRNPAHRVAYAGYWDRKDGLDCKISDDSKPVIGEIYKRHFGRT